MNPNDLVLVAGGGICCVLVVYAGYQLRPQNKNNVQNRHNKNGNHHLAEISRLWTETGNKVIDFRSIARIWREPPEVITKAETSPEYNNPEIQKFHSEWISLPTVKSEKKRIIESILSLLDDKGDCPSVVQLNKNEAENKYDKDVFVKLAKISLWKHSLAVAQHVANSMKQGVMIPDALIAGLGHDLGKIPEYQKALYKTGDHPVLSIIALNRIPGYESMSNADDVSQAIKQHHHIAPESPLGIALKEADKKTRLEEISRMSLVGEPEKKTKKSQENPPPSPIYKEREKTQPKIDKKMTALTVKKSSKANPDTELSISLDLRLLLSSLKKRIDKVEKGRWSIISTPEGIILCQQDALWHEIKRMNQDVPELLISDADEASKRKIIKNVIEQMEKELDAIETSLLGKGYYTVQCLIVSANGKAIKVPLIPFRGKEAFDLLPSQLEVTKTGSIKRLVQRIKLPR